MTREAKIGMLTGLGVIVVIGVLLSEYLGDRNTGPTAAAGATGRMAPLPVGDAYRQTVLAPVGVPAMTRTGGGQRTQLPGGGEIASPIATAGGALPPTMFATDTGAGLGAGPKVGMPVSPLAAGPTLMDGVGTFDGPPTIRLESALVPAKMTSPPDNTVKINSTTYVIAQGDTLAKIAKTFYGSSKNSDVARIVAANKGVLKDASAMLVVNKKLVIPNVPAPAVPLAATVPAAPRPIDPGVVSVPGGALDGVVPIPGVVQPPKKDTGVAVVPKPDPKPEAPKAATYVVQSGDTLEKIARKLAPTKVTEMVATLTRLNAIKDPSKLKVGQVLKVSA